MDLKCILFDLENTLYKNREFDKQYPKQITLLLSRDKSISVDEAKKLLEKTADELKKKSGKHVTKVATMKALGYTRSQVHEAFFKNNSRDYLKKDSKLDSMLSELSRKYKLGIVSNFRSTHTRKYSKHLV